jgi:hypothetical protein
MYWIQLAISRDPKARDYTDAALRADSAADYDSLEMFQTNDAARKAGDKAKRLFKAPASDSASHAQPALAQSVGASGE